MSLLVVLHRRCFGSQRASAVPTRFFFGETIGCRAGTVALRARGLQIAISPVANRTGRASADRTGPSARPVLRTGDTCAKESCWVDVPVWRRDALSKAVVKEGIFPAASPGRHRSVAQAGIPGHLEPWDAARPCTRCASSAQAFCIPTLRRRSPRRACREFPSCGSASVGLMFAGATAKRLWTEQSRRRTAVRFKAVRRVARIIAACLSQSLSHAGRDGHIARRRIRHVS